MDISPDGKRLLVLTYDHVWEIAWDLADGPPPAINDLEYQFIPLDMLLGKESVAWLPDGGGFVHGKESSRTRSPRSWSATNAGSHRLARRRAELQLRSNVFPVFGRGRGKSALR